MPTKSFGSTIRHMTCDGIRILSTHRLRTVTSWSLHHRKVAPMRIHFCMAASWGYTTRTCFTEVINLPTTTHDGFTSYGFVGTTLSLCRRRVNKPRHFTNLTALHFHLWLVRARLISSTLETSFGAAISFQLSPEGGDFQMAKGCQNVRRILKIGKVIIYPGTTT